MTLANMWTNLPESELDIRVGGCLQGGPGCGKSFLLAGHIARAWRRDRIVCLVVSPSAGADRALGKKLSRNGPCFWQSLLLPEFRQRLRRGHLYKFDVLVVDEFTLLTKDDLLAIADLPHPKVFVGDLRQLKAYPQVGSWPLFARLCNYRMHWVTPRRLVTRYDATTTACLLYLQEYQTLPRWCSAKRPCPDAQQVQALRAGDFQGTAIKHPFTLTGLDDSEVTLEHMYVAISRATKWDNIHFEYTDRVFPKQT